MTALNRHANGFTFGPAEVTALTAIERRPGAGEHVVIRVKTSFWTLDVYVSPSGLSVRVFRDHVELLPAPTPEGTQP